MPIEIKTDKDGNSNYIFDGKIAIGGEVGENYTVTLRSNDSWQPVGYITDGYTNGYTELGERVEYLEKLVKVLANALGVNEEFLFTVA